jgi:hypothetical protein
VPKLIGLLGGGSLPDFCEETHDLLLTLDTKGAGGTLTQRRYGNRSPPSAGDCL